MAKKIVGYIKLQIPAGKANPSPPVGPALGQRGLNIMAVRARNSTRQPQNMEPGMPVPVVITAFADRTFTLHHEDPAEHVFPEEGGEDRQGHDRRPARAPPVGPRDHRAAARDRRDQKMKDMNANDVEAAVRMLAGSARSMGLTVVEG